jgi:hypothetical protein
MNHVLVASRGMATGWSGCCQARCQLYHITNFVLGCIFTLNYISLLAALIISSVNTDLTRQE